MTSGGAPQLIGGPMHQQLEAAPIAAARLESAIDTHMQVVPPRRESRPVALFLLGPFRIEIEGVEARRGWRVAAKQLLSWYGVQRDGASAEAALDALWPDVDPGHARQRVWASISDIRKTVREATKGNDILVRSGPRYSIDPHLVRCDLWELEESLAEAARASDATVALGHLEEVQRLYRGHLVSDLDAPWIEPVREELRQRVLQAHLRLATLHEQVAVPEASVAALERAIELDPDEQESYRRLIGLHERLGNVTAVRHMEKRWADRERELGREQGALRES